jgi:hypothetical protein
MRFLFIAALLCLVIASCADKSSSLVGRWELDEIDYTEHYKSIPEEARALIRTAMDKAFKRLKGKTFFTFSENEKLTLEAPNFLNKVKRTKGNWKMNDAQDSLRISIADEVENYRIVQLSADSLILSTMEVPARTLILLRKYWKD